MIKKTKHQLKEWIIAKILYATGEGYTPDLENVQPWKRILLQVMTIIILVAGIYNTLFHERFFGILTLIALTILYAPGLFTGNRICVIPLKIRILLLMVMLFELVIGDGLSAYTNVPLYDKFMHTMVPAILGLIGIMFIYTAYAYDYLKARIPVMFIIIVFIVIGFGAVLEMSEYFYDQVLYPLIGTYLPTGLTQGSPIAPPLADTMEDLYFDTFGAIFGAALGVWIIRRSLKKGDKHLLEEIADLEGIKK
jgi:hypothetical protein